MALINAFSYIRQNNTDVFTLSNDTIFGTPNPDRNAFGINLIVAKVNKDAVESFLTVTSTPYATKNTYDVSNSLDGHYLAEFLRFPNYNAGTNYVALALAANGVVTTYPNLIYYPTTGLFYRCILAVIGIAPDAGTGPIYWQVISSFTASIIRLNTTIDVGVFNFLHDVRSAICTKDELYKILGTDPNCINEKILLPYLKKAVYLQGARNRANDLEFDEAEYIIRVLETICGTC